MGSLPPQLVDWMLWHNENQQPFSWLGIDWGARGGITARELALWTTLQREYRARGLLPGEALSRFDAIGVQWDSAQASGAAAGRGRGHAGSRGGGGRAQAAVGCGLGGCVCFLQARQAVCCIAPKRINQEGR